MHEKNKKDFQTIPRPHCAPEDQISQAVFVFGDALLALSQQITAQCQQKPDMPLFNKLVLERGELLGQVNKLQIERLAPELREWLIQCLMVCQALDAENTLKMQSVQATWGAQLKSIQDACRLMQKYQSAPKQQTTRMENA